MKSLVIIGGGAAGLMAAVSAGKAGQKDIILIEKNERPARKVMITGKGRCNVTNNSDIDTHLKNAIHNGRFMYSAYTKFGSKDTMRFFEEAGVPLKTERGNRVFPESDKAVSITDALVREAKKYSKIVHDTVKSVAVSENGFTVISKKGKTAATAVIIATGGNYYSLTGSTGDGYKMAKALGHSITDLSPSLIGLYCRENFCSALAGLTLKNISFSLMEEGRKKPVYKDTGETLFTHNGISGPLVLTASALMKKGKKYSVLIDLKPGLDENALNKRVLRDFAEFSNKDFKNALQKLLPLSLIPVVIKLSAIKEDTKVNQITAKERENLCKVIKGFRLDITGTEDPDRAVVTRGGVSVKEINPATMESKIIKGLFFAGEVIDVDALTGGFNLQIAFSSGNLAGISAAKYIIEKDTIGE